MTDYTVAGTVYRHPDTLNTLITIAPTPTKGLAIFALRDLPPNTLILSERPLVALRDNGARADPLDALVRALPPPLHRAYRALHAFTPTAPKAPRQSLHRRVLYSNGFAVGRTTTAVFEVASRFNHACVPNARFSWDEGVGRMEYFTVRGVRAGEEVCVDYGHARGRLVEFYGFECACGRCEEWGVGVVASSAASAVCEGSGEEEGEEERTR